MKTIRHRRADKSKWHSLNPVIPDGEIALIKGASGYDIVVGDGEHSFSELPSMLGEITVDYDAYFFEHTFKRGDDLRLGMVEELYLDFPSPMPADFFATLSFDCDEFGTSIYLPSELECHFTGSSVEAGEFIPEMFVHYTLVFWYDGGLECAVRGRYYG